MDRPTAASTISGPPAGPRMPRIGSTVGLLVPWSRKAQVARVTATHPKGRITAEYRDSLGQMREFRFVPRHDPGRPGPAWLPKGE